MAAQDPTINGFLSDGQRDGGQSLRPGPSFGPGGSPTPQLGVFQPLNVDAAHTQAEALASALGVANSVAQPVLLDKIEKQSEDEASKGKFDAATGNVDPNMSAKSRSYADAALFTQHQSAGLNAVSDAKTLAATPSSQTVTLSDGTQQHGWGGVGLLDTRDASGNLIPGLSSTMDNFFRGRLNGIDKDPRAAKALAPMIGKFMAEATSDRIQQTRDNNLKQALSNAVDDAALAAQTDTTHFNYSDHFKNIKELASGDGVGANAMLSGSFIERARALAVTSPSQARAMLALIPSTITDENGKVADGPAKSGKTSAAITEATLFINQQQKAQDEKALNASEIDLTSKVAKGADPMPLLEAYKNMPYASAAFYRTTLDWVTQRNHEKSSSVMDTQSAADMQGLILTRQLGTAQQVQEWVAGKGYSGGSAVQLMAHGMEALQQVQRTTDDDISYRSAVKDLDASYSASLDPLTKTWTHAGAQQQHNNVLRDFTAEYLKGIDQKLSPDEATHRAQTTVTEKYGAPLQEDKSKQQKIPQSNADFAAYVRNSNNLNKSALKGAGVDSGKLRELQLQNLISPDEAHNALAILKR